MNTPIFRVGVVMERRTSSSPWADYVWRVAAIVPEAPGRRDGETLGREGDTLLIYAGSADIEFHRVETSNYRDNLAAGRPNLWVKLLRRQEEPGIHLLSVTADPSEGEAMTETGDFLVEVAPMPVEMAERLAAFVREHHVERIFTKRKRQ
jgi:hypothetical protein